MKKKIGYWIVSCMLLLFSAKVTAQIYLLEPVSVNVICSGTYLRGPYEPLTTIRFAETNPGDFAVGFVAFYTNFHCATTCGYYLAPDVGSINFSSTSDLSHNQPYGIDDYSVVIYIKVNNTNHIDTITISGIMVGSTLDFGDGGPGELNYSIVNNFFTVYNLHTPLLNLYSTPNPVPTITFTPEPYYCSGENQLISLSALPLGGVWTGPGVSGDEFNSFGLTGGIKSLRYTIQNGGSCSNSASKSVEVKATPTVSLTSSDVDNSTCAGTSITFTATSTGNNKRYQFFKNDIPVTALSATNTYTTSTLGNGDRIGVDADNGAFTCVKRSGEITQTVISNPNATIQVSGLPPLLCSNNTTTYPIVTAPPALGSVSGTGVSGAVFSPILAGVGGHILTYNVSLSGCSFPVTTTVIVSASPTVQLTSSDANGIICEGESATFTANTEGTANRYLFLKNANGIQGPNGIAAFTTTSLVDGDELSVLVDNGAGTCPTSSAPITITVGKYPVPAFAWQNTCGSNQVTFNDTSDVPVGSSIVNRSWDFTNNGTIDYSQPNEFPQVQFTYPSINEYQARLVTTTDKGCSAELIKRVYTLPGVTPTGSEPYAVNFAESPQGWAYDGENASWGWGLGPIAFGASRKIWSTGQNSGDGNYKIAEKSYLYGPCVNLSQLDKPMIAIKVSSKMIGKPSGAILEATNDDGLNWIKLGKIEEGLNWYNEFGIVSTPSTLLANSTTNNPSSEGWAGNINFDNDNLSRLSLQPFVGSPSLRFRINFESVTDIGAIKYAGIAIDSFWIGNRNKVVLLEHFTTQLDLDKCYPANLKIDEIKRNRDLDVATLFYHTSFPSSDVYNQFNPSDPSSRVLTYGISKAPFTTLDGNYYKGNVYSGGTSLTRIDTLDVDARVLEKARFKLDLTTKIVSGRIDAAVRMNYIDNLRPYNSDVVMHIAIVEDTADGNININSVLRKMLPDASGSYISNYWLTNPIVQVSQSWSNSIITLNKKWVVIAFLQNLSSNEILQVSYVRGEGAIGDVVITNREEEIRLNKFDFIIYPNPVEDIAYIKVVNNGLNYKWQINNNIGEIIDTGYTESGNSNIIKLDTHKYSQGVYYVKMVDGNNNTKIGKFVVIK